MPTPGSCRHYFLSMRKLFFLCALFAGVICGFAQEVAESDGFLSKVTVRPTIGLNLATECSDGITSNTLVSFKIGAIADYAFRKDWGFRSGLLLSGQGGKYSQDVNAGWIGWSLDATDNPWYLEIPLNVYYSYNIKEVTITGFTGFPLAFGLFGNYKIEDGGRGGNGTVGDTSKSSFDDLKRFALCYNIGVEATWRKFTFGFEYNRHLTSDSKLATAHLQVCSFNLGYNFKL